MNETNVREERKRRLFEQNKMFILKAAEIVFAQNGYSMATVDDIAKEAHFSKATLYRYYKSKREIFLEIIHNTIVEARKNIREIQQEEMTAEEKLRELTRYILTYFYKKKNITWIVYLEKFEFKRIKNLKPEEKDSLPFKHPPIPGLMKNEMEEISNIICEIINEGVEKGEFRKVNIRDASFIFGALIRGFFLKGPVQNVEYSIDESVDLMNNYFLYGIKKERKE